MLLVESGHQEGVKLERGKLRIFTTKSVRNSPHNKKLLDDWYSRKRDRIFKQEYIKALELFNYKAMPKFGQRAMARRWEATQPTIKYSSTHGLSKRLARQYFIYAYMSYATE